MSLKYQITCPDCGYACKVRSEHFGRKVSCVKCKFVFRVNASSVPEIASSPPTSEHDIAAEAIDSAIVQPDQGYGVTEGGGSDDEVRIEVNANRRASLKNRSQHYGTRNKIIMVAAIVAGIVLMSGAVGVGVAIMFSQAEVGLENQSVFDLNQGFLVLDSKQRFIVDWLDENIPDNDSIEIIEWGAGEEYRHLLSPARRIGDINQDGNPYVSCKFRCRNSFGGMEIDTLYFFIENGELNHVTTLGSRK